MFSLQFRTASCITLAMTLASQVFAAVVRTENMVSTIPSQRGALRIRDNQICGGLPDMQSCGSAFPSSFCCSTSSNCLKLNTNSSVTAVICCPAGQDCTTISPIGCDRGSQDPNISPTSQLHSDPTLELQTCGGKCCPMGFTCHNSICIADFPFSSSNSTASVPLSRTSLATSTPTSTAANFSILPANADTTGSQPFSGTAFAAGFLPGLTIGAFLAALCMILLQRRRRRVEQSYNEKRSHRDTLTNLEPLERRSIFHNRSISEPIPNPSIATRTEFLRSSPQSFEYGNQWHVRARAVESPRPVTPSRSPRIKALFSHSPFLDPASSTTLSSESSLPGHLKRGTLSFRISPVRALRKQRSMYSLRRKVTDPGRGSDDSHRQLRSASTSSQSSRGGSLETIQVVMHDTPSSGGSQRFAPSATPRTSIPSSPPPIPSSTQQTETTTPRSTESRVTALRTESGQESFQYGDSLHNEHTTTGASTFLGSPYTPTRAMRNGMSGTMSSNQNGLGVPQRDHRNRDTTFSALMERAGLSKDDLIVGANH